MHPRLEDLFACLVTHRADLAAAVERVPPALREQRSAPDRWSVAEILEHLSMSEGRIARLIAKKIAEGRAAGLALEEDSSPIPSSRRLTMILEREQRVKAPDFLEPRSGMTAAQAWEALGRSREALRAAAMTGDGLALGTLTFPHPIAGELNLYQWIAFVGVHEGRHAEQIREIVGV